jgi:hypothetical protein
MLPVICCAATVKLVRLNPAKTVRSRNDNFARIFKQFRIFPHESASMNEIRRIPEANGSNAQRDELTPTIQSAAIIRRLSGGSIMRKK